MMDCTLQGPDKLNQVDSILLPQALRPTLQLGITPSFMFAQGYAKIAVLGRDVVYVKLQDFGQNSC